MLVQSIYEDEPDPGMLELDCLDQPDIDLGEDLDNATFYVSRKLWDRFVEQYKSDRPLDKNYWVSFTYDIGSRGFSTVSKIHYEKVVTVE